MVTGILRVVSAGVCSEWYAGHGHDSPARSNPTRFYVKQSMTSSFNAIAIASLVGFDLRTTRASFVAYRYRARPLAKHYEMPCSLRALSHLIVSLQEKLLQLFRTLGQRH